MLKFAAAFCLIGVLFLLGACSPAAPPATATPSARPPTVTPAATATPGPTVTPLVRATFPPTWTPEGGDVTESVDATPTRDARFDLLRSSPPPPEVCGKFGADLTRSAKIISIGSPAQIFWVPAKDVSVYEVTVYGPDNTVVGVQRTTNTTMTLRAALFSGYNQPYAWLVTPLDRNDKPICFPRGAEFRTAAS